MFNCKAKFILASTSFIRRQMLDKMNIDVSYIDSGIDEAKLKSLNLDLSASEMALVLSDSKAQIISKLCPNQYVIGADQIALFQGNALNKTSCLHDCIEQLKLLEGELHQLFTATSLFYNGNCIWHTVAKTTLKMKPLTINQIQAYVKKDKPLSSTGAYYYEENGASLFSNVDGETETILGFELTKLFDYLRINNITEGEI